MKIVFTRKKKKMEIPLFCASEVKLYAVPAAYSADGYFVGIWASGELEPVPGSAPEETELLAHLVLAASDQGGELALRETFCAEGVTYALD